MKLAIEFTKFENNQENEENSEDIILSREKKKDCRVCKENEKKSSKPYECNIYKKFMHERCFKIRHS